MSKTSRSVMAVRCMNRCLVIKMKHKYKVVKNKGYSRLYEDDVLVAGENPRGGKYGQTKQWRRLDKMKRKNK